jgi:hypothetical protein
MCFWFNIKNKGIRREKHDMTAACPQGKVVDQTSNAVGVFSIM